jgi:hypothetical protein
MQEMLKTAFGKKTIQPTETFDGISWFSHGEDR